ncbi:MAG: hypothetical protein ABIF12_00705 [bacterium]
MKTNKALRNLSFELYRIEELKKISRSLHKLAEYDCNFGLTDRQQKREDNLRKKAAELAQEIGFVIYYQGDPRGCALYLLSKDMNKNNYNSGIALY